MLAIAVAVLGLSGCVYPGDYYGGPHRGHHYRSTAYRGDSSYRGYSPSYYGGGRSCYSGRGSHYRY
jgi:hypothetical protein